jgi:hypothetical protein
MRPTTQDLLKLRDGEPVSASLAAELQDPEIRHEVQRLDQVRRELQALPVLQPPAGVWDQVLTRLTTESAATERPSSRRHWQARLALAASVALVAVLVISRAPDRFGGPAEAPVTTVVGTDAAHRPGGRPLVNPSYVSLAAESRRLERALTRLDNRPRVINAGTASTIAELEDRIALVDYQLGTLGTRLTGRERTALWQQRVDLMNSLVMVRYAQAQGDRF